MLTSHAAGFLYRGLSQKKITSESLHDIAANARALGFARLAALRVSDVEPAYRKFYADFLLGGKHAGLNYLSRPERFDLRTVFPGAETLILFTYPYRFPGVEKKLKGAPYKIARYAWQRDYHVMLKEKLHSVAAQANLVARAVTDSAPVFERYWARRAGLGMIGRNGMLIDPGCGSYFMIASLLVKEELAAGTGADLCRDRGDHPLWDDFSALCKDCQLCIEACPTSALSGDGLMDAAKCISYQTIEAKADAPVASTGKKHRWIFGCDICQQVCPYNKTDLSFAPDQFSSEHPAAEKIAAGRLPATRSELKDSVFFRRGIAALARNLENVS